MRMGRVSASKNRLSAAIWIFAVTIACLRAAAALEPPVSRQPRTIDGKVTLQALLDVTSESGKLLVSQGPRDMAWHGSSTAYVRVPGGKLGGSGESLLRIDAASGKSRTVGWFTYLGFSPDGRYALRFDHGELLLGRMAEDGFHVLKRIPDWSARRGIGKDRQPVAAHFAWSPDSTSLAYVAEVAVDGRARNTAEAGTDGFELKLVDLRSLEDSVVFGPRKVMPSIGWSRGRKAIIVATEPPGDDGSAPGSRLIEVSLAGERKRVLVEPALPARMVQPLASPDGKRLVYLSGQYFHPPVPFALPVRNLDLESGESASMQQVAGIDTRSLQWGGTEDLWAACRKGPLRDSLCRLKLDGSIDFRLAGPFREEIKRFEVSPDGRRIVWTSLDVLGTFRVRMLDIGADESRVVYRSHPVVDESRAQRVSAFTWKTRDGIALKGLLVAPEDPTPGRKYPLIVDVHGSSPVGLRGALFSSSPLEWQMWSDMGYLVFVSDYRESGVYGTSEDFLRSSPAQFVVDRNVDDVIDGIEVLKKTGMADSRRIAIVGHSMGSVAANHMLMRGERFRAVVSKEGIPSWNLDGYLDRMKSAWMWWFNARSEEELKRKLSQNSLQLHLDGVKSPVLFINAVDENPDAGSLAKRDAVNRIVAGLRSRGLEADAVQLPDERHVPMKMCNVRRYGMIAVDWIAGKLR